MKNQPADLEAKPHMELVRALEIAKKRWERKNRPDEFHTRVTANHDGSKQTLKIRIQHHETFPAGGQTFNTEVRKPPYGPDDLLARERIDYIP